MMKSDKNNERKAMRAAYRPWLAIALLPLPGCGLLTVREDANAAVAEWAERRSESDVCRLDAMQHCTAASAAASECGATCAIALGSLLELRQADFNRQDLRNNQVGASSCAVPISGQADGAVACCEELLNRDPSALQLDGPCN